MRLAASSFLVAAALCPVVGWAQADEGADVQAVLGKLLDAGMGLDKNGLASTMHEGFVGCISSPFDTEVAVLGRDEFVSTVIGLAAQAPVETSLEYNLTEVHGKLAFVDAAIVVPGGDRAVLWAALAKGDAGWQVIAAAMDIAPGRLGNAQRAADTQAVEAVLDEMTSKLTKEYDLAAMADFLHAGHCVVAAQEGEELYVVSGVDNFKAAVANVPKIAVQEATFANEAMQLAAGIAYGITDSHTKAAEMERSSRSLAIVAKTTDGWKVIAAVEAPLAEAGQ